MRFVPDRLHFNDDFFVRFAGLYNFRERFCTDAQVLKEPLVGWSRIDIISDRRAQHGARFVGDSRQPGYASHYQRAAPGPKLRSGALIVHLKTPFII